MNKQRCEIGVESRAIIVKLLDAEKTLREIENIIGRSHSTVQTVIKNF